jgi:hypothetical protein
MSAIVAEFSIPLPDALVEIGQEHSSQQKLCLRLRTTFIVRILTHVRRTRISSVVHTNDEGPSIDSKVWLGANIDTRPRCSSADKARSVRSDLHCTPTLC